MASDETKGKTNLPLISDDLGTVERGERPPDSAKGKFQLNKGKDKKPTIKVTTTTSNRGVIYYS